jgi:uncharacterized protein (DUF934 family)
VLPDRVIRHGRVEPERWRFLATTPEEAIPAVLPAGPIAAPLAAWKARRAEFLQRREPVGVWLASADDPAEIAPDLGHLSLVAVHFPKFADGRGFSTAVLLRTRFGYRGELRAFGDVGRDQLFELARCGFDAFSLAPHRDPESALAGLEPFSLRYQGSVDDPLPLFRKRFAAAAPR